MGRLGNRELAGQGSALVIAAAWWVCFGSADLARAAQPPPAAPEPSAPADPPPADPAPDGPPSKPPAKPPAASEPSQATPSQRPDAEPAPSPEAAPDSKERPDERAGKKKEQKGKRASKKKEQKGKRASKKKEQKGKRASKKRGKQRFRGCPKDMVAVRGTFCIDRYEAYVVEMLPKGRVRRHSPFEPVAGKKVKAMNRRGRMPQAYISRHEAEQACQNAKKRLCTDAEWVEACKGRRPTLYPYGKKWKPGRCNDQGVSSFNKLFGEDGKSPPQSAYTWDNLNDPRLNRPKGTCAPAGRFRKCRNSFKIYDMVGNLHEWTSSPAGTFRGGYYLDVHDNGHGCEYKTTAHGPRYRDYSTGFRCCK